MKFLIPVFIMMTTAAQAGEAIRIVGSSTVYPFTTVVAEAFAKTNGGKAPIIEATGTGGGMKIFCAGNGEGQADAVNASRRIKDEEAKMCAGNGVKFSELEIGYDGIVLAQSKEGQSIDLTIADLIAAIRKDSTAKTWADVNSSLPPTKIAVVGPPPTSGTRDSLIEILKHHDKSFDGQLRTDGGWIDGGENDNFIVEKLTKDKNLVGVFGWSFYEENQSKVRAVSVDVEPTIDTILDGKYPFARPLYVYFKDSHSEVTPSLQSFKAFFMSQTKPGSLLEDKGLIIK